MALTVFFYVFDSMPQIKLILFVFNPEYSFKIKEFHFR